MILKSFFGWPKNRKKEAFPSSVNQFSWPWAPLGDYRGLQYSNPLTDYLTRQWAKGPANYYYYYYALCALKGDRVKEGGWNTGLTIIPISHQLTTARSPTTS